MRGLAPAHQRGEGGVLLHAAAQEVLLHQPQTCVYLQVVPLLMAEHGWSLRIRERQVVGGHCERKVLMAFICAEDQPLPPLPPLPPFVTTLIFFLSGLVVPAYPEAEEEASLERKASI